MFVERGWRRSSVFSEGKGKKVQRATMYTLTVDELSFECYFKETAGGDLQVTCSPASSSAGTIGSNSTAATTRVIIVRAADWRSFGFGPLKELKAKHRDMLKRRVVNGLEVADGKVRLKWVWVLEREKNEKEKCEAIQRAWRARRFRAKLQEIIDKRGLEKKSAEVAQRFVRSALSRMRAKELRLRLAARIEIHRFVVGYIRRREALMNSSAIAVQFAWRVHRSRKRELRARYEMEQRERAMRDERDRSRARAKEMARRAVRGRERERELKRVREHDAWVRKKMKQRREEIARRRIEEEERRVREEEVKSRRLEAAMAYRDKISRVRRRESKEVRRRLLEAERRIGGSTILERLEIVMGFETFDAAAGGGDAKELPGRRRLDLRGGNVVFEGKKKVRRRDNNCGNAGGGRKRVDSGSVRTMRNEAMREIRVKVGRRRDEQSAEVHAG